MRRSVVSILVALFAITAILLGRPSSGWTQDDGATPEPIEGVTTTIIGWVHDESADGVSLVLVEVSLEQGPGLAISPDIQKAVLQIVSGTAIVKVNEAQDGQAYYVRDGEKIPLSLNDEVELVDGDVLSTRGADLVITNPRDEPVEIRASLNVDPRGRCWICPLPFP